MKNIFVLPSDKPSRLYLYKSSLGLAKANQYGSDTIKNQNIYITNSEKPKVGDWVIEFQNGDAIGEVRFINSEYVIAPDIQKKIILTTDIELIKNGVQAIDDNFLEWFVKNSSCEFVEIEREECQMWSLIGCDKNDVGCCKKPLKDYKPIIPQQPKKENTSLILESPYQNLFEFFSQEHDLILTISEMDEIVYQVAQFTNQFNKQTL